MADTSDVAMENSSAADDDGSPMEKRPKQDNDGDGVTVDDDKSNSSPKAKAVVDRPTAADGGSSNSSCSSSSSSSEDNQCDSAAKAEEKIVATTRLSAEHSFKRETGKFHLLIGVTGSVAAIKLEELVAEIRRLSPPDRLNIRMVTTEGGARFFDESSFEFPVYKDCHEWEMWKGRGDPVVHIELRKWADVMVIAPLDANTLAKVAGGLCDNLLTSVVRAWDPVKPLYFCPAMNTYMFDNPLTFKHLETLKSLLGYKEIPAIEKQLICGDRGYGAMATVQMISSVVAGEVKKRFAVYSIH